MSNLQTQQLLRLTALLQLEKRARAAGLEELGFVMVNETMGLLRYRQALLWQREPARRIVAVSGVAAADPHAPYVVWAGRLCAHLGGLGPGELREFGPGDVPDAIGKEWGEWLPPHLVWVPLGGMLGALVLAREEPLGEGDKALLTYLADAYGHAWRARLARRSLRERAAHAGGRRRRLLLAALAAAVVAAGFLPVRQSVLAPAEIIPRDPAVIRAPLEGVVYNVLVKPNEEVSDGQVLFTLDPRRLRNQLEVSTRTLEAADAELRQARQSAVMDQKVRATLPSLQGKVEQQQAEVNYLKDQLARIEVRSAQAGLAVFDDPNDWLGRPVAIGERVMLVADPAKVEVEVRLPVADAIDLEIGSPVRLFLNIDPERARDAVLTFASYQPQKGADGVLSYRVKAMLDAGEPLPRIGLKGTAKLYGVEVPLAYSILRRPISAARQWLGF